MAIDQYPDPSIMDSAYDPVSMAPPPSVPALPAGNVPDQAPPWMTDPRYQTPPPLPGQPDPQTRPLTDPNVIQPDLPPDVRLSDANFRALYGPQTSDKPIQSIVERISDLRGGKAYGPDEGLKMKTDLYQAVRQQMIEHGLNPNDPKNRPLIEQGVQKFMADPSLRVPQIDPKSMLILKPGESAINPANGQPIYDAHAELLKKMGAGNNASVPQVSMSQAIMSGDPEMMKIASAQEKEQELTDKRARAAGALTPKERGLAGQYGIDMSKLQGDPDAIRAAIGKATMDQKEGAASDKAWTALGPILNPFSQRNSTGIGKIIQADGRANRALVLLNKPSNTPEEAAIIQEDLAGIVKDGSPTDQGEKQTSYDTLYGKFAKLSEKLTGDPYNALTPTIKATLLKDLTDMHNQNTAAIGQHFDTIETINKKTVDANRPAFDAVKAIFAHGTRSGIEGVGGGTGAQSNPSGPVRMQFPDGTTKIVQPQDVAKYSKYGKIIQ